jgi:hypothetical protein
MEEIMSRFLGTVKGNKFHPWETDSSLDSSVRLTRISIVAGASPESQEIDLAEYEDSAIMVEGTPSGAWIYEAEIVDKAGPILTEVVQKVFSQIVDG